MKNDATLSEHLAGPYQKEMEHYSQIVADVGYHLDSFNSSLQATARIYFDKMIKGEFSQVVALLPYWLSDVLPLTEQIIHKLGVAHLFGWWYYEVQDKLLDEETDPSSLLAAQLALFKMIQHYQELGVMNHFHWRKWEELALQSANRYALERQTRFQTLAEVKKEDLETWTIEFIIERASPFYFNTMVQLHLAGVGINNPLYERILNALRYFAAARQVSDDASDWLNDLRAGRLNYVSARLIEHVYEHANPTSDLDIDYLVGYQLTNESFWPEIEAINQQLSQRALTELRDYPTCHLATLIKAQMVKHAKGWNLLHNERVTFLQLFGVIA